MKTEVISIINQHSLFEIITHEGPDPDAVGSSLALGLGLQSLGKSVRTVYPSPVPEELFFTSRPVEVAPFLPEISILVDVADMNMIGKVSPQGKIVVIDHHVSNDGFGNISWVETSKSSAAEMIFDLFSEMGLQINAAIAQNLYMGIFGDTGGFMHANTTERVFEIARDLTHKGADPTGIAYILKKNRTVAFYEILCLAIKRMRILGGIYASYISQDDLGRLNARAQDVSGVIDEIANIAEAKLSIFIKQLEPDKVSCSMRSRDSDAALQTALAFGGGGHAMAAGFSLSGQAPAVLDKVIEEGLKWVKTD
ncbi:MAG: bifunctional oligoribonuclease/PAP phosphatase NrnA [Deltaproteobacteria bacterium]|nr:bifunctional oligoribonuclease/PAP phosphatase NrnA [Deltaproteobacteria bacterium]